MKLSLLVVGIMVATISASNHTNSTNSTNSTSREAPASCKKGSDLPCKENIKKLQNKDDGCCGYAKMVIMGKT
jgi:hypothetical protein